ncbi:MAG TPA: ABC transporter transmembrane domain-containing protein [Burkholderiaceae bacterium]|nr:ABC transporter transmembrane domain-containing protein [Burkholderiaceae bacterium]
MEPAVETDSKAASVGLPAQPATAQQAPARSLSTLRALAPFIAPYWRQIAAALLFLLLASLTTLALPYMVRLLVDHGLALPPDVGIAPRLIAIRHQFGWLFVNVIALAVFASARFYMVTWIGERVTADLRQAVYAHVLRQNPQFFETLKTGEVLSRLTTDTTVIQTVVGSSVSMGLRNAVLFVGALALLVAASPRLMLTVAGVIALVVAPALIIGRRVRRLSRASQDRIADTSGIAGEVLNAIPVVQSFTQEQAEAQRYSDANEAAFATSIRRTGTRALLTGFVIVGAFGSLLYGLHNGVQGVLNGSITAGQLSQIALYITLAASSVAVLAEVWGDLLRAAAATERLSDLLATRPAIADPVAPRELPAGIPLPRPLSRAPRGTGEPDSSFSREAGEGQDEGGGLRVNLQQVTFAYPSRPGRPVISDLSLIIEAGQSVALVGPSGAGKSTIFQLLQRFYDVSDGSVLVGGVDVRQVRLADLRHRIAVVPQEPVIFSGTLLDNIRYGRSGATLEEALAAGRAAHVEEFVGQLPQRYDTYVGERGLRLSGGQRQRIAIARAMLKNAPLLLLDEATSSLDAESERAVQLALQTAMRGRTTIVIAHRLATVQRADRIFVLDHGAIVDSGSHAELVARAGLYSRLAALQFSL